MRTLRLTKINISRIERQFSGLFSAGLVPFFKQGAGTVKGDEAKRGD